MVTHPCSAEYFFFASPLTLRTHTFSRLEFSSVVLNMVVVSVDLFFFWMDVAYDRKIGSGQLAGESVTKAGESVTKVVKKSMCVGWREWSDLVNTTKWNTRYFNIFPAKRLCNLVLKPCVFSNSLNNSLLNHLDNRDFSQRLPRS
jgi:hypothetical protein